MATRSLRPRGSRKAALDDDTHDFKAPLITVDDTVLKTRKRKSKITEEKTEKMTLRPRRSRKALDNDIYEFDTPLESDNDNVDEKSRSTKKRQKNDEIKESNITPVAAVMMNMKETNDENTESFLATAATVTTTNAKRGRKKKTEAAPVVGNATAAIVAATNTKGTKKRMKKYDHFDNLSDDIILYIFKFIASPAALGPFGTCFENVFTLCQFRYISVRMSTILSTNVICATLLNRDKLALRKKIIAEKEELGNCCLSTCKDVYRIYEKELTHLVPKLRRNPHYRGAAPMKLYSKLMVIKLCLKKYGSYDALKYYQDKKRQNRVNKSIARLAATPRPTQAPYQATPIRIPVVQRLIKAPPQAVQRPVQAVQRPVQAPPQAARRDNRIGIAHERVGGNIKNLRCDLCADKQKNKQRRLFSADGLRQHTMAKHNGVSRSQVAIPLHQAPASSEGTSSSSSAVVLTSQPKASQSGTDNQAPASSDENSFSSSSAVIGLSAAAVVGLSAALLSAVI
jgi:hypothetical protein